MTHLSSLGAGMFSDLSVAAAAVELTPAQIDAMTTEALFTAAFADEINAINGVKAPGTFVRIKNIREFPAMGVPANIVNVPRFGSRTSGQVQGQADAQSMELTLNYVAADWAKGTILGDMVGDGIIRPFRFTMLNSEPDGYGSTAAELGTVENTISYFLGKIEAQTYSAQLTDANQSTITISMLTDLYGTFTV